MCGVRGRERARDQQGGLATLKLCHVPVDDESSCRHHHQIVPTTSTHSMDIFFPTPRRPLSRHCASWYGNAARPILALVPNLCVLAADRPSP